MVNILILGMGALSGFILIYLSLVAFFGGRKGSGGIFWWQKGLWCTIIACGAHFGAKKVLMHIW